MKLIKTKLKIYINLNLRKEKKKSKHFDKFYNICSEENYLLPEEMKTNNKKIKDFINSYNNYNDFQTLLFKLIDEKKLKDSDVYNKVHIDRRLFSKIRSDKNYHPSKETIILLAISLELNEKELDNLLNSASYSLPKNNQYDLIIRFCFINKIYDILSINELLDQYQCKLFNY